MHAPLLAHPPSSLESGVTLALDLGRESALKGAWGNRTSVGSDGERCASHTLVLAANRIDGEVHPAARRQLETPVRADMHVR